MVKRVQRYQSNDGRLHETMGSAMQHEQSAAAIAALREEHYRGCCEDVESLMEFLAKNKIHIFKAMEWSLFPCLGGE